MPRSSGNVLENNETTAIANPQLDQAVFLERTKLSFTNIPASIIATFVVAPYLLYVNRDIYGADLSFIWAGYMFLTMLYRYVIFIAFKKDMNRYSLQIWNRLFLVGVVSTAIGWGITGSSLMLTESLQQQMFTTIVLAGLSSGALATLTPLYSAFVLFTVINMVPLLITLLNYGAPVHYATASLVFIFMAFIITSSARMAKTIQDSISLRFQHDNALKVVAAKKQQTDELNLNLRQQINERELIEHHLEYSMSQLKATLESATDGILVIDNDEQVTNYNQNFIDLFDIPITLIEIADFSQIQGHINSLLKDKTPVSPIDTDQVVLLELKDGRLIEAFSKPQKIADQIIGNVLSYRDATMRINSESSLQEAKTKAEVANKQKSEFLSRISHELRTPLNAILGFGHLLQEDNNKHLDTDERDYISHICVAGEHLLHLIDDLLDISRIESGKLNIDLSNVSCEKIVNESVALVRPSTTERNIKIIIKSDFEVMPFIQADHTRCKQALVNLLSNAIKYNKESGSVTLTISANASHVHFEVKDTGAGISEDSFKDIFQPFIRLKQTEKTKGTGIGLTITKRLIDIMNGSIGVESTPGEGSTFWFELPIASTVETVSPMQNIKYNQNSVMSADKQHTILYVEDEPLNQALLKSIVKQINNTRLLTAATGEEGIEIAMAEQPDIILMDINLPGISGYEVLKVIKNDKAFSKTPIFALSANAMPNEIKRGRDAGFFDYLIKPINIDNTRHLLKNTLNMIDNDLI